MDNAKQITTNKGREWRPSKLMVVLIVAVCWFAGRYIYKTFMTYTEDTTIINVENIRRIGQWEFLSSYQEVFVSKKDIGNIISDNLIVRKYVGQPRMGIDLSEFKEGCIISQSNDSVVVLLPPVKLLDEDFIDESETTLLGEYHTGGKYRAEDQQRIDRELAIEAKKLIRDRFMTKFNIQECEENVKIQFAAWLKAYGFKHVVVRIQEQPINQIRLPMDIGILDR